MQINYKTLMKGIERDMEQRKNKVLVINSGKIPIVLMVIYRFNFIKILTFFTKPDKTF